MPGGFDRCGRRDERHGYAPLCGYGGSHGEQCRAAQGAGGSGDRSDRSGWTVEWISEAGTDLVDRP